MTASHPPAIYRSIDHYDLDLDPQGGLTISSENLPTIQLPPHLLIALSTFLHLPLVERLIETIEIAQQTQMYCPPNELIAQEEPASSLLMIERAPELTQRPIAERSVLATPLPQARRAS